MCKSFATHRVLIMCSMLCAMGCEGTAQLLRLTSLNRFYSSFILLAEPLTDNTHRKQLKQFHLVFIHRFHQSCTLSVLKNHC